MNLIKEILLVIANFSLAMIGITLFWGLFIVAFIVGLIRSIGGNRVLSFLQSFFFNIGYGHDQMGNASYSEMLNGIMRKSGGYEFGNPDETVSSALGKNQRLGKATIFGWILILLLWIIDLKYITKGGHCINSIEEDEN